MTPMRDLLLWASRNDLLRRRVPRLWVVRSAVRRFMPGETLEAALGAAEAFARRSLPTTFTYLGENVASRAETGAVTEHYLNVLDRVAERSLDTEVSVKLTHLGFDLDPELAAANLERLVLRAREGSNWVWIDMESSPYVDGTLAIYRRALTVSPDVGVCLQAYLHRTVGDVEDLLPLSPSIRLVKGAYREPEGVALTGKASVDRNFLGLSERILRGLGEGHVRRFAAATHDLQLIGRIDDVARGSGRPPDSYEIQMLYGIRQAEQFRLAERGRRVRSLIAYGPAWYAWYMRRLAENPVANLGFVVRNVFTRVPAGATGG